MTGIVPQRRGIMDKILLSSGFTISIKPLAPYYLDFIDDILPFPSFPCRKITLTSGDVIDYEYIPPEVAPIDAGEDLDLYLKYKNVEKLRSEIETKRQRAKRDFLLSTCIYVEDGPIKFEDKDWEYRIEAAFPRFTIPQHPGRRMLAFLKGIVITTKDEMELIINRCLYKEVDMQSIVNALQGFRLQMERSGSA